MVYSQNSVRDDDMRVYVKRGPHREVVLATRRYGLSFRSADPQSSSIEHKTTVVPDFFPIENRDVELERFDVVGQCYGCLGLINHGDEVFVCVIMDRSRAAKPTPHRTVYNIHSVEFFGLIQDFTEQDDSLHPLAALRKFFSLGGFLYSSDFDLTAPVQASVEKSPNFMTPVDESFMWNQFMTANLNKTRSKLTQEDQIAVYEGGFLTTLIRGFASTVAIEVDEIPGTLTVLSKQSWLRAGTRFNSRGIDDDGNVANFVESETILWLKNGQQFGFVQLRGSVPLFWEQDPQLLSAKINITRPVESTEPATRKHFDNLINRFGAVHIVDLLASSSGSRGSLEGVESANGGKAPASSSASLRSGRSGQSSQSGISAENFSTTTASSTGVGTATEADLSLRYQRSAEEIQGLRYTHFDFHKEVAGIGYSAASKLVDQIQPSMLEFGFYSSNPKNQSAETEQIGVFRVNCLDCLDRTNLVQQLISKDALDLFLDFNDMYGNQDLWEAHANLWADNGDQLSQNYTGTGALKSSFTRSGRMGLAGALSDVSKSVSRLYINNFVDKTRQSAIDELLGRSEGQQPVKIFDPINDHMWEEMKQRTREYSSESQISVFAATFNVNGRSFGSNGSQGSDIADWLFPPEVFNGESGKVNPRKLPDMYIIAFQELVELTTSQILNVDPSRKEYWEREVSDCLNSMGENYLLLRSGQLVGTAMMLFVKKSQLSSVTEVEGTSKKTALGGITGNKGGVAVGFKHSNTRFVVVNSHLAAGMHNLEDRHNDYKLLLNGLRLSGNRRIKDADIVIWMGDFNYRVDLPSDTIRKMIKQNRNQETINKLLTYDQLTKQMELGETFPYFQEADITFMPTYKYDPGTDSFDSEKQRAPAWTDRVLVKGKNIKKRAYNSVPSIKFSDHRPVYALFDITVSVVDEARADKLYYQLYDRRRDYLLKRGEPVLSEANSHNTLQHPSSETQKWWAGGGMPTKIPINAPKDMVLNPEKLNPFSHQPDFVQKPAVPLKPSNISLHSPSPPLVPSRSPASGSTGGSGAAPAVPPPRGSRKPVPNQGSEVSLLDVPISESPTSRKSSPPAQYSNKNSNPKSRASSLMDSEESNISYKSLI